MERKKRKKWGFEGSKERGVERDKQRNEISKGKRERKRDLNENRREKIDGQHVS